MARPRFPQALSDAERLALARTRTGKLIDHLCALFTMHEANAIVVYSPTLARQIPRSHAASAFNQLQTSLHLFEFVRLCALWDSCRDDRESIPTILALIDKPDILRQVVAETHAKFANSAPPYDLRPSKDPVIVEMKREWWMKYRAERAEEEAARTQEQLAAALLRITAMQANPVLKVLRDFRDEFIAHNLSLPKLLEAGEGGARRLRYGDERPLLRETIKIADLLHRALNDTTFFWLDARRMARRDAKALWTRCTFNIDPRA